MTKVMDREDLMKCVDDMLECLPDQLHPSDLVSVMVATASAFAETKEEVVEFTLAAHALGVRFMLQETKPSVH